MIRRTREDVGRELPDLVSIPHQIDCDDQPLDQIKSSAADLARIILSQHDEVRGQRWKASEELSNVVRQATGVAKAPHVANFVRMLVDSGEPVVLYGWHREVYSILMERLRDLRPALYTGSESPKAKEESKRRFVSGETDVLIMSLRSGAGLDGLQNRGRTVVFGELDWSPAVHIQCSGRVHRDGQQCKVVAYYLLADGGSDPIIADVLGLKRAQIEGVIREQEELVEKLEVDANHIRRLAESYLAKEQKSDRTANQEHHQVPTGRARA
jgi:SNF2 family DNA or RNA helicase